VAGVAAGSALETGEEDGGEDVSFMRKDFEHRVRFLSRKVYLLHCGQLEF
jgi:hypothetical protein